MKQKIKLFIMLWKALNGSKDGWVFFSLNNKEQQSVVANKGSIDIKIRYVGVDERVVREIANRISKL